MVLVIRGNSGPLRRAASFLLSAGLHGSLLVWLVAGPTLQPTAKPHTVYEQEIKPHINRLVWYNLRERLPAVKPLPTPRAAGRPRARARFQQELVAGTREARRPKQLILQPAPP